MKRNWLKTNLMLFLNSLYLSTFTFGGGFVMIPLMRKKYVTDKKLITAKEMIDISSIAQATPGAIAVNSTVLIGYKINGISGALFSMLGTVIPPLIIISIISFFYELFSTNPIVATVLSAMQAGIGAIICDVAIKMGEGFFKEKDILSIIIMPLAFAASFFLSINVVLILLVCIAISIARVVAHHKLHKNNKKDDPQELHNEAVKTTINNILENNENIKKCDSLTKDNSTFNNIGADIENDSAQNGGEKL